MSQDTVKVTDSREPGYFSVDNEIMDDYGLDEIAFYLYSKVCRHAFNNKNCYFSLAKLKKKLKWGNSTVSKALNTLKRKKLVSTERVEGKGYRFFLLPVKKTTLPPSGTVNDNHSPDRKAPSPHGKTTLPPSGNKEDVIKQETNKKKAPFPHPEFSEALERWDKMTGQEKTPTRSLQKLYFGCVARYGEDKVHTAIMGYGQSKWHKDNQAWILEKLLASKGGEVDKFALEFKNRGSDVRRRSQSTNETLERYDRKRPEGKEADKVTSAFKKLGKS